MGGEGGDSMPKTEQQVTFKTPILSVLYVLIWTVAGLYITTVPPIKTFIQKDWKILYVLGMLWKSNTHMYLTVSGSSQVFFRQESRS